jgi:hypothetical protein
LLRAYGSGTWRPASQELAGDAIPALPAFAEKPRSLAGEHLGVAMSIQLDELMLLRRQEEVCRLLRGRLLARYLRSVLEVRVVEELPLLRRSGACSLFTC